MQDLDAKRDSYLCLNPPTTTYWQGCSRSNLASWHVSFPLYRVEIMIVAPRCCASYNSGGDLGKCLACITNGVGSPIDSYVHHFIICLFSLPACVHVCKGEHIVLCCVCACVCMWVCVLHVWLVFKSMQMHVFQSTQLESRTRCQKFSCITLCLIHRFS